MSLSTVKGEISTNFITWFIALLIGMIVAIWFITNNPFAITENIDLMNEDLLKINEHITRACNTMEYHAKYNPITEEGYITFDINEACIGTNNTDRKLRRCEPLHCEIITPVTLDLSQLTYIIIDKQDGISIDKE